MKKKTDRNIYLDCSYIVRNDHETGIQRVVRNILNNSSKVKMPTGWNIRFVVWDRGAFKGVTWPQTDKKEQPNYAEYVKELARFSRSILPSAIYSFFKRGYVAIRPYAKGISGRQRAEKDLSSREITPTIGDTLVLLDSSWHIPYWREIVNAKRKGAKVGMVAYDLIPIDFPQFCDRGVVASFTGWLSKALYWSDFCLAISETTGVDVSKHAKNLREQSKLPELVVKSFRMGTGLDKAVAKEARPEILKLLSNLKSPYVCVGTVEPRKNQIMLLSAFEILWRQGENQQLCLIGRPGWHTDKLIKRIKSHSEYGRKLFWLSDLNDAELTRAYKKAAALIIPSIQEGYGLPIIEALNHRKQVFASDIPVFREVGGKYCTYFALGETKELASLIREHSKVGASNEGLSTHDKYPSWSQSTEEFIEKIIELAG